MDDKIAIEVNNVSKAFKLPHEKQSSIKGLFISMFRSGRSFERQQVLKDISINIKAGEFFGIVGRNGSGKSTLLKLLAGVYSPDRGAIRINGKLTPFIELGVGFNPELTGRENVFLNGALLGFNRKEMEAMYDEIVAFAELERFMDQKLKNYSSGMQVRLAFSIAIRAKTEILILDEVLAVGDEAFQKKCVEIFERYKAEKRTVVLVTHDMEAVRRFCSRAILIQEGEIIEQGQPSKVAAKYSLLNRQSSSKEMKNQPKTSIKIDIQPVGSKKDIMPGDKLQFKLSWTDQVKEVKDVGVAIIKNSGEYIFGTNTLGHSYKITNNSAICEMDLDLGPGKYYTMAGLFGETKYDVIDFVENGPSFEIQADPDDQLHGMMRLKYQWLKEKR